MKLLAIETATEACSAALLIDQELAEQYQLAPQKHAELILPMVDGLLSEAGLKLRDLDAIAFGKGPGSFTGLRIAAGVVQGIAFGAELPVVPVSTLAALAHGAMDDPEAANVLAALDARMGEIYWGRYVRDQRELVRLQGTEQVTSPEQVIADQTIPWIGVGSGWTRYQPQIETQLGNSAQRVIPDRYPRAADIALLAVPAFAAGATVEPQAAKPEYLRNQVARKPTQSV